MIQDTTDSACLQILVVEDDPVDADLLDRHCRRIRNGTSVLTVHDTAEGAHEALRSNTYDLVVVDYMIGGDSGVDFLTEVRESGSRVPIIFMTGHGGEEVAAEALRAGATDYLPKNSLSVSSFSRAMENAVEKGRLEHLLQQHRVELEAANKNLIRRNHEIQEFYHVVSHELKTPLTSTQEFISIVIDGLAGPLSDEQTSFLMTALEGCHQMKNCIDDLLDSTRLDTGKMSIDRVDAALSDIIPTLVEVMTPLAAARGVHLLQELAKDLPDVFVDPKRITQVVQNIISNAIKYSDQGGAIIVGARRHEDHVEVSVRDSGPGIPEEHRDRIFEKAHQVCKEDAGLRGGLGIGLSLCRQLVELHGGSIRVESEMGEGSNFVFTLPVSASLVPQCG